MSHAALNACLNAAAAAALVAGLVAVRRGRIGLHRAAMLAAFGISCAFLVSYVLRHLQAGVTPFPHAGARRAVYLSVLASHTVLAAAVPPMAVATLWLALRNRVDRHRRWARWTWPLWMYVSVSGVLVYFLLFHS